jgi:hypothetical protein
MMSLFHDCTRVTVRSRLHRAVIGVALLVNLGGSALAVDFTIGAKETIYTKSQRSSKKLAMWPDGSLGVVSKNNGTYEFYGANGSAKTKTTGTLQDPAQKKSKVTINGVPKKTFNYLSGGPVYQDPTTGARLMIYHAEKHGKSAKDFYSVLGMAVSTDPNGLSFRDLGLIVTPNQQNGQTEVGGGSFAVVDGHLNVYYRDWFPDGTRSELAVARAPVSEIVNNALNLQGTSFSKYYNGSWSQPGLGGLASALEVGNPSNAWVSVSYNDYLNELVMVSSQWTATQPDLYMATSSDGVNWSPRQALVTDVGEQFYPSLIGTGSDPTHTGQSFYIYYTDSQKGAWNRWQDAALVRREITLTSPPTPPVPEPLAPSPTDWATVADFGNDFQIGGPASGWTYAWNPTGQLGNSYNFLPLLWSDAIQAYNTTGAALQVPGAITHNDDYLHLSANGGHPGKPGFASIAGYTIQGDDGAGFYRLADASIQKSDGITSANEDGLQVLLYLNQTKLGSATVSTDGLLTNFGRNLGELNVGDTIWVMVNPLATQAYDSFTNFNFSIQKAIPLALPLMANASSSQLGLNAVVIPEPSSVVLLLMAFGGTFLRRIRQRVG